MGPIKKKQPVLDRDKLKKGQLIVVKVAPFFDKEYLYEISGAGGSMVRATLYHSPTVKKQWSIGDLQVYFANGIIRFAKDADVQRLQPGEKDPQQATSPDSDPS